MTMKNLLILCLLSLSCACSPTIHYFNVMPFIDSHYTKVGERLTLVIDKNIPNDHHFSDTNLQNFKVTNFRQSLRVSLYNTFEASFDEVSVGDQVSDQGWSLILHRVRPFHELVPAGETTFHKALIRYEASVYYDGEKIKILDEQALSEEVAIFRSEIDDIFEDGIKQMCKQLYISVVEEHGKAAALKM